jgi:glc operon protein GlcG
MGIDLASRAAEAASRLAASEGETISVAVVDDAGHVVLLQRGDGCSYISCETALGKAKLANGFRLPTRDLAAEGPQRAAFWASVSEKLDVVLAGGGYPIVCDGLLVGAIGCGGGHGPLDETCARAGAEAVSDPAAG